MLTKLRDQKQKGPQEKLKTMLMQNVGVRNKEHYGMLWFFLEWSIPFDTLAIKTLISEIKVDVQVGLSRLKCTGKTTINHHQNNRSLFNFNSLKNLFNQSS